MKRVFVLPVGIAFVLCSLTSWTQDRGPNRTSRPPAESPKAPLPQVSPSYVIGPDDTLYVSVWKEPDLTATLPVRADGMISLPLLNDVQAAGLTPMQLAASITEKLKKYVTDPRVTVVVTQMN